MKSCPKCNSSNIKRGLSWYECNNCGYEISDIELCKIKPTQKITNKIKNTTEPEEWKDNGNEDL
jgi:ribosomal protein L37AE/L43A